MAARKRKTTRKTTRKATTKRKTAAKRKTRSKLTRGGITFSGYNKPRRTPGHAKKSHAVLAKSGSKVKLIRFGQQGVSGAGKNPKTSKQKARRKSFKARHAANIRKGVMSAAYWANRVKW